ncbi:hypothetical protein [Paenibacillus sp. MER 99-2]|uniref:hypothetical protein n=1 Tax=Paenibacillus sp. MER 99-2 TaxID=2939572 RepID=UPI00203B9108|nr:hypothetical protein [Paenibacillus sp. MER 99-2]MCM3176233.1 hypothetical protein [Paenibacillus sp. MER 99-2]
MADITRTQNMGNKDVGSMEVMVPPGMKYLSILNAGTDNTIEIYEGQRSETAVNVLDSFAVVQPYQNTTRPIRESQFYTIVWRTGGKVSDQKILSLIFSQNNLGINFQGGMPGTNQNMTLTGDTVGLAKASQLPGSLNSGNLRTAVMNDVNTKLVGEIPAGTKQIGSVKVDALPDVTVAGEVTTRSVGTSNVNVQNTVNARLQESSAIIGKVALAANVPVMDRNFKNGWLVQGQSVEVITAPAEGIEVFIQSGYKQPSEVTIIFVTIRRNGEFNPVAELRPGDTFQSDLAIGETVFVSTDDDEAFYYATSTWR